MAIALDHIFIVTEPGAPAAAALLHAGLIEGPPNTHPGQGTANRRFFFANSMLELLYVHDAAEAEMGPGSGLRFVERTRQAHASPFGIVVSTDVGSTEVPFPAWRYYPEYFPADQCFYVGENSDVLEEPLCICLPPGIELPKGHTKKGNPLLALTEARIGVPVIKPSPTLAMLATCAGLSVKPDEPHSMELVFNDARDGISKDMRPELPLVLRW